MNTAGFTVIEIIVTIIIFIIFIEGAFQTYVVLESQRVYILRQSIASDMAYTNLRKFPTRPSDCAKLHFIVCYHDI
jgi:Tfp pilus assembly protein PilE